MELGTLRRTTATLHATPRFFRSVPYALKTKVGEEINRLLQDKIISPVKYSGWAAVVVPILKPDSSIRFCGDYKLTVNIGTVSNTKSGRSFCSIGWRKAVHKLDMNHAYQQIIMDENSKKYFT